MTKVVNCSMGKSLTFHLTLEHKISSLTFVSCKYHLLLKRYHSQNFKLGSSSADFRDHFIWILTIFKRARLSDIENVE